MNDIRTTHFPRRVYPLSPRDLTEEELAVVFAMTSRRPEPFDDIARQVTAEKAADFHERWVVGYGHASVAEHAVLHMAVENVSRLACDSLEDNRLASYTEKSSRFQVLPQDYYHVPAELKDYPSLKGLYVKSCEALFAAYGSMVDRAMEFLRSARPRREGERDSGYNLRLRREAADSCRFLLPAATLTNVGVTMNARVMEHAITKLRSSELAEERELGDELKERGREITPTLIKYAEPNDYLTATRDSQREWAAAESDGHDSEADVALVHFDPQAEVKVAAALLFRFSGAPYREIWRRAEAMGAGERGRLIASCLDRLGPHDSPTRELEVVDYTFEFVLDYGAYREYRRHRMQTYLPQPLTVANGYVVPPLVKEAGLKGEFEEALRVSEEAFRLVMVHSPAVAQYLVTHAHKRRVLAKMNLRECYHLFKLRTQQQAHFSIRKPMEEALRLAVETHPALFRHLQLREYPDWWTKFYGS